MVAFPVHVGHGSTVHGDSPGKNTGVGSHALLQGTFPSQGSNPHLLHCRWILYQLTHLESPIIILLLTKKQNKANCPQVLAPSPPRDRPLHRTAAHIPRRFVGLPARHASPESPGLWMRGPDSAHWTTGCGKETARVKGGPASALKKQQRAFPPPPKAWHLLWATLTCLFSWVNVNILLPKQQGWNKQPRYLEVPSDATSDQWEDPFLWPYIHMDI